MASASADKQKARTALLETHTDGAFMRRDSTYRQWVGKDLPAEAGRYHLYISYACPWACRCLTALYMKGLEDAIGVSIVHPTWQRTRPDDPNDEHTGWTFASPDDPPFSSPTGHGEFPPQDCIPDTVNGFRYVRDLYEKSNDTSGKYTVPVLWDKESSSIVNNESADIMRMFNSAFDKFAKQPELDLYPEDLRAGVDAVNEWVYPTISNGVYRCGFAQKQAPYEQAFKELFESLDRAEEILSKQRYIAGDRITEADIRLFQTLIRFDPVYVVYFKCNRNFLHEMPNLRNYVRDMYQTPGIAKAVNIYHIKTHYFTAHPTLNHYAVVPVGCSPWWEEKHDRDRF